MRFGICEMRSLRARLQDCKLDVLPGRREVLWRNNIIHVFLLLVLAQISRRMGSYATS